MSRYISQNILLFTVRLFLQTENGCMTYFGFLMIVLYFCVKFCWHCMLFSDGSFLLLDRLKCSYHYRRFCLWNSLHSRIRMSTTTLYYHSSLKDFSFLSNWACHALCCHWFKQTVFFTWSILSCFKLSLTQLGWAQRLLLKIGF